MDSQGSSRDMTEITFILFLFFLNNLLRFFKDSIHQTKLILPSYRFGDNLVSDNEAPQHANQGPDM